MLRGEAYLLWQAADQHGADVGILLQKRRDKVATKRFFERLLAPCPELLRKIVTDQLSRREKPRSPNWQTSSASSSKRVPA